MPSTGTAPAPGEKEPAIIYLYGEGPVATVFVDEKGKPYPLAAKK